MPAALRNVLRSPHPQLKAIHTVARSPRRKEVEAFIRDAFARRYNADVPVFAPNLMMLEEDGRIVAAAGWRCAGAEALYLEAYLDGPIEEVIADVTGRRVLRRRIVEVGNLASDKAGASVDVILTLAKRLDILGYEWVTFTATREVVGVFSRLGLPLLTLASADPARLGAQAGLWGSYYESGPIVVAGKIRLALERHGRHV